MKPFMSHDMFSLSTTVFPLQTLHFQLLCETAACQQAFYHLCNLPAVIPTPSSVTHSLNIEAIYGNVTIPIMEGDPSMTPSYSPQ